MKAGLVFSIIISLCTVGCSKDQPVQRVTEVITYTVEPRDIPVAYHFVGVAESSHKVEVWARVSGYLDRIEYQEGAYVKEGDPLFQIDPKEYEIIAEEWKGSLEKEEANLWAAKQALARYEPLYEQRAASRKDLDNAIAQVRATEASVSTMRAKHAEAELDVEYTAIKSPISGLTTEAKYQEGTFINPSVNGLLTTVSVIDPIWIVINVSDYYFLMSRKEIDEGTLVIPEDFNFNVTLTLADGSSFPYEGKVNFVSPVLNPSTGTLSTRAVFPNPDSILKPGQFVRAKATGAIRPNAIAVPQKAVLQDAVGTYVWIVNNKSKVEARLVETYEWYGDEWVIKSGLKKGERVIVEGINKVKEGELVRVKNQA